MSDTESTRASTTTLPTGEAVDRPLTNKEKRHLAVAEKRRAKETASSAKRKRDDEPSSSAPTDPSNPSNPSGEGQEEVLSHKEQRRRKKVAKLSSSSDPSCTSDPSNPTADDLLHPSRSAGGPATQPRSGYSIWIGNLSFFTPPAKLVDWFNSRGVDGISRVNMPKGQRRAEMNRGFCYLDLPSKDILTAALNLSEQPLDGRKLLIKDASDFTGRPGINSSALGIARTLPNATQSMHSNKQDPEEGGGEEGENEGDQGEEKRQVKGKTGLTKTAQKILRAQKNPPSMTLFLGNLSFNTTEQGVRELLDHSATKRNPPKASKKERKQKSKKPTKKSSSSSSSSSSPSSSSSSSSSESDSDSDSDSDSGLDEEEATDNEEKKDSKQGEEKKQPAHGEVVPSSAGIRKVRLGTFEDAPTKCKGFGFLDFHTVEQATASLLDPRNTLLDGRKIILQYASADATRRGASKTQKTLIANRRPNELRVGFQRKNQMPRRAKGETSNRWTRRSSKGEGEEEEEKEEEKEAPIPGTFDPNAPLPKKHKETKEERMARRAAGGAREREKETRARPGAALANAQRASVAIMQSTGTKVTFDD
ncbi:related to RNA-binding protein rnp24 [Ustilago sp. UG-2017a]|nr:related to RNA-binding protein rnp24 [Ustilago sp. UG-2017a]